MAQNPTPNEGSIDPKRIDELVRLAMTAPDDALLRTYFAACSGQPITTPLTDAEQRWVFTNLQANPAWQAHWNRLEIEFGRPVSWRLQPLSPASKTVRRDRPSSNRIQRTRYRTAFRLGSFIILLLTMLYGALWIGGRIALPETHALASLEAYQDALTKTVRSSQRTTQQDFAQGTVALLEAPQNTFGLFPHYDETRVERAMAHLHRAFDQMQDPFHRAEIAFFLAKASLMNDDSRTATTWLEQVLAQNVADYREDATVLLNSLSEQPAP